MAITGYAAVFYDGTPQTEFPIGERWVERFDRNAFTRYLDDASNEVHGLFNHDMSLVLGRRGAGTLRLRVDETGLFYEISDADTGISRDVRAHTERGDIAGSSVGFAAIDERHFIEGEKTVRLITEAAIRDVGPVTYPAYEAAGVEVRCIDVLGRPMALPDAIAAEVRSLVQPKGGSAEVRARLIRIDRDNRRFIP